MILPIYIYNEKVLTTPGSIVEKESVENLPQLIEDMFETMYAASGIGLAAHQVGLPIKLFVIDITNYSEGDENLKTFKKVFINSEIIEQEEEESILEEGCLSVPALRFNIKRPNKIKLRYLDENFVQHEEWFDSLAARCIQHEHDHTNGIMFMQKTSALSRRLAQGKLRDIVKRNFSTNYKYKI